MQTNSSGRITDIDVPFGSVFKLVFKVYAAVFLLGVIAFVALAILGAIFGFAVSEMLG